MSEHIPVIELESYRISDIEYKVFNNKEDLDNHPIENGVIGVNVQLNEDETNAILRVRSELVDENNLRSILFEITGFFIVNTEEMKEEYLRVNGTAILLPYLRTLVSIMTSLDNKDAIILPTLNTNVFSESSNKDEELD